MEFNIFFDIKRPVKTIIGISNNSNPDNHLCVEIVDLMQGYFLDMKELNKKGPRST